MKLRGIAFERSNMSQLSFIGSKRHKVCVLRQIWKRYVDRKVSINLILFLS